MTILESESRLTSPSICITELQLKLSAGLLKQTIGSFPMTVVLTAISRPRLFERDVGRYLWQLDSLSVPSALLIPLP